LPSDWFAEESASFDNLHSVSAKQNITRTSTYIKNEDLLYLKSISKKTHVPVAQLVGDIVSKFVQESKKAKKKF